VLRHILCRAMAHFVPCYGTFCAFLWHKSLKVLLCRAVAHKSFCAMYCCGTFCTFLWHIVLKNIANEDCKSRIASQELQAKNCKSRKAKKSFRQFGQIESFLLSKKIFFEYSVKKIIRIMNNFFKKIFE
jgi:hypothetical protein